jgi:hypothetical protein
MNMNIYTLVFHLQHWRVILCNTESGKMFLTEMAALSDTENAFHNNVINSDTKRIPYRTK